MDENELMSIEAAEEGSPSAETAESAAEGSAAESTQERDFSGEVSALLTAFPDMAGQSLPDEVVHESVTAGVPLVRAYAAYRERSATARIAARHSAQESYAHAPVRAASVGAPHAYAPADPFLEGLNAY